jgi:hypothetical protein
MHRDLGTNFENLVRFIWAEVRGSFTSSLPHGSRAAIGGNPLGFRRLGFVVKFHRKRCVWSFLWAGNLFRRLYQGVTIRPFISSSTNLETWGAAFPETDVDKSDLETIIGDLMSGQYSDPVRVVAFNTAEQWVADVSQDVAHEIRRRRADLAGDDLAPSIAEFVETHASPARQLSLRLI